MHMRTTQLTLFYWSTVYPLQHIAGGWARPHLGQDPCSLGRPNLIARHQLQKKKNATGQSAWCCWTISVVVVAGEVEVRMSFSLQGKLVGSQSARLSSHCARVVSANRC
jgi:hypothetical protein